MNYQLLKVRTLVLLASLLISTTIFSQNPNFYIYICFGQSNMEGQGTIETQDKTIDARFKVLQALECSGKSKGVWRTAVPPLCQCYSGLSPADNFGRTMVANLPDSITVGVINVAIGGCDIRIFDKDIYANYDSTYTESWFTDKVKAYEGNPYKYLMDLAKLAQQDGVIKGILLHQGETNTGDSKWPTYVKKIYNDMLTELSLDADSVPLLAGQVLSTSGNCCSSMNTIINKLHDTIPSAYVISSSDCAGKDNAHFNSAGYRKLGKRYAVKMLSLLGYNAQYAETECATVGENLIIKADDKAANASFVTTAANFENITSAPTSSNSVIQMNVTLPTDSTYYVYGRFNNADTANSYWIKIDNGAYELIDNLTTTSWQWLELKSYTLTAGSHTIYVAIAKSGGAIDKLVIKNSHIAPVDIAEEASNVCVPVITPSGIGQVSSAVGYVLEQNYPNPFSDISNITFEIPSSCYVSLKVYNSQGIEVAELAGKKFDAGKHTVTCNLQNLPAGNYYYTIKANNFSASKNLILKAK